MMGMLLAVVQAYIAPRALRPTTYWRPSMFKKSFFPVLGAVATLALTLALIGFFPVSPAHAQAGGAVQAIAPLTRDLGALSTFTAKGASTVSAADQNGYNVSRVVCAFNQATSTGAHSTTFSIQNKDTASGLYYTLVQSAAMTSVTTYPIILAAGAGVASASAVSVGLPIAQKWRVQTVIAGTLTPTITGTVGCSVQ